MELQHMACCERKIFIFLLLEFVSKVFSCDLPKYERFECGYKIKTEGECSAMNCCYNNRTTPRCYYKTKDAAGGPIQHSNGLCVYPKGGSHKDYTLLVWSSNCFSRDAVFVVDFDYPTYHVASGKCIWPKSGKVQDPEINGELVLLNGSFCLKIREIHERIKFRPTDNGNLEFYSPTNALNVCLGEGRDSSEPQENEPVLLPEKACEGTERCQHLTYVYQNITNENDQAFLICAAKSSVQVIWAYYGPLERKSPAQFSPRDTKCAASATKRLQEKCEGEQKCSIDANDSTFLGRQCVVPVPPGKILVVRFTCKRHDKPAAPIVIVRVTGTTQLDIEWSFGGKQSDGLIDEFFICLRAEKIEGMCTKRKSTLSGDKFQNLKPSTKYFIKVAAHSCDGGVGDYSETTAITRAEALEHPISHDSFIIFFGKLQLDDSYVQIIVKKLDSNKKPETAPETFSDLKSKENSEFTPYIAAEVSRLYVEENLKFTVGDGKYYSKSGNRTRRDTAFRNAELDSMSYYSVFQRTFKKGGLYYNTDWMQAVRTEASPFNPKTTTSTKGSTPDTQDNLRKKPLDSYQTIMYIGIAIIVVQFVIIVIFGALVYLYRKKSSKTNLTKGINEKEEKNWNRNSRIELRRTSHEYEIPNREATAYEELRLCRPENENAYQSLHN